MTEPQIDLSNDITGLNLIPHGAKAESKVLNDNFTYLNNKTQQLHNDILAVQDSLDNDVDDKTQEYLDKQFLEIEQKTGTLLTFCQTRFTLSNQLMLLHLI